MNISLGLMLDVSYSQENTLKLKMVTEKYSLDSNLRYAFFQAYVCFRSSILRVGS